MKKILILIYMLLACRAFALPDTQVHTITIISFSGATATGTCVLSTGTSDGLYANGILLGSGGGGTIVASGTGITTGTASGTTTVSVNQGYGFNFTSGTALTISSTLPASQLGIYPSFAIGITSGSISFLPATNIAFTGTDSFAHFTGTGNLTGTSTGFSGTIPLNQVTSGSTNGNLQLSGSNMFESSSGTYTQIGPYVWAGSGTAGELLLDLSGTGQNASSFLSMDAVGDVYLQSLAFGQITLNSTVNVTGGIDVIAASTFDNGAIGTDGSGDFFLSGQIENSTLGMLVFTGTGASKCFVVPSGTGSAETAGLYNDVTGSGTSLTGLGGLLVSGTGVVTISASSNSIKLASGTVAVTIPAGTGTATFGTAAFLNSGTSANNLLQITNTGTYPALNGSLITGITATFSGTLYNPLYILTSGSVDQAELSVAAGGLTILGGTNAGSAVILQSTSGTGTSGSVALQILGGTNGATTLLTMYNSGSVSGFASIGSGSFVLGNQAVSTASNVTFNQITAGSGGQYGFSTKTIIKAPADSQYEFLNNGQTGFSELLFGGTSGSFAGIWNNVASTGSSQATPSITIATASSATGVANLIVNGTIQLGGTGGSTINSGGATSGTLPSTSGYIGLRILSGTAALVSGTQVVTITGSVLGSGAAGGVMWTTETGTGLLTNAGTIHVTMGYTSGTTTGTFDSSNSSDTSPFTYFYVFP